jgi:hypothetical protein
MDPTSLALARVGASPSGPVVKLDKQAEARRDSAAVATPCQEIGASCHNPVQTTRIKRVGASLGLQRDESLPTWGTLRFERVNY